MLSTGAVHAGTEPGTTPLWSGKHIPEEDLHPGPGSTLLPQQPSSKEGAHCLEGVSVATVSNKLTFQIR